MTQFESLSGGLESGLHPRVECRQNNLKKLSPQQFPPFTATSEGFYGNWTLFN